MSKLSVFINGLVGKTITQQFVSFILSAAKLFIGKVYKEVYTIVQEEVVKAESSGGTGWDRWKIAYEGITKRIKTDVPEFVLSILMEAAVAELKGR